MHNKLASPMAVLVFFMGLKLVAMDTPDIKSTENPKKNQLNFHLEVGIENKENTPCEHDMEDFYLYHRLSSYFNNDQSNSHDAIFGVFDGHGGEEVAEHLANELPSLIAERLLQSKDISRARSAIIESLEIEDAHAKNLEIQGSTAAFGLLLDDKLFIAHVGDSRVLVVNNEGTLLYETRDHKPNDINELKRIKSEGGSIKQVTSKIWRLGPLAMSRTIGDYPKPAGLSCKPDIFEIKVNPSLDYVLIASDGFWDAVNTCLAISLVKSFLAQGKDATTIAENLVNFAAPLSSDDITVVFVKFIF